jgi:uncharacterized protein
MQMSGQQRIGAARAHVWAALNDPEVLRQCIPGCQSLEKTSGGGYSAIVAIKVGPISARFTGAVTLSDIDAPNGYTITGEGQGGAAGFAKGAAKVKLAEDGGATLLSYEVDAQVGGRLAQLGGPIVDATAKQLAAAFFTRLGEAVAPSQAAKKPDAQPAKAPQAHAAWQPMAWMLALVACALVGVLVGAEIDADKIFFAALALCALIVAAGAAGFAFGRRDQKDKS